MKAITSFSIAIIFVILFSNHSNHCFAQGTWTQMANFGGTARSGAVGFSIGTKGYIGTGGGVFSGSPTKDFWEWDGDPASPTYNTWTQKADFGGTVRYWATGFSIGTKGYIGMGWITSGATYKDFWEWDGDPASPTYNTWTKKSDFGGGTGRYAPVGFSIGTKGYIGLGRNGQFGPWYKDFWEWDGDPASPTYNTWTKKADFGGTARWAAVGFSISTKGYIGTGTGSNGMPDFWEWDGDPASPTYNTWTQKADIFSNGYGRMWAVGFSIGNKGYIGTGYIATVGLQHKDLWEWDGDPASPTYNTWTKQADMPTSGRLYAVGFSIGNCGYIGTGGWPDQQDFWRWCPGSTLPISLLYFTAALTAENHVLCSWATASESNNDYFLVQRSRDAQTFETIGQVDGAGNSSATLHYAFTDQDPYTGVSYYRLKQVDFNGNFTYSEIRAVYIGTIDIISIFPNPASDYIEYLLGSSDSVAITVTLYDAIGREVYNKEETIEKGVTTKKISTANLSNGNYLLRITNGNKEKTQKQFVIK